MRIPLYLKLAACLALNIVAIAVVVAMPVLGKSSVSLNEFLPPLIREQLVSISQQITDDIAQSPDQKNETLGVYSAKYGVTFKFGIPDRVDRKVDLQPIGTTSAASSTNKKPSSIIDRDSSSMLREYRAELIRIYRIGSTYQIIIPTTEKIGKHVYAREVQVIAPNLAKLISFLGLTNGLWMVGILVLVSILIWTPLIFGMTRTMIRINRTTGQIANGNFDVRLNIRRRDELGSLSDGVNRMAERLQVYMDTQKTFMADIAHEVTSPLARMRMGLSMLDSMIEEPAKSVVADIDEDAEQMSRMLTELLMFSRASMSPGSISLMTVVLSKSVDIAIHQENAKNRCSVIVPDNLKVTANAPLLVRAISNLIRNGIRYAPPESGPIEVAAGKAGEKVYLCVSDRGPGVPGNVLQQLGQPFYRPDISRNRDSGGFGLGLAIVKRCVEAGGGSVTFMNREGGGFQATMFLPVS